MLFFVTISVSHFGYAQQTPVKADSTKLYENIESYSKRSKFTQFMYKLIFKPVAIISPKKGIKKKVYKKLIQKPYSAFEGKIIRQIEIRTLDPFGYSIADTAVTTQNFLLAAGNKLHFKSQHVTIRNLLLIRQNQKFDSLLAKESERLVRSQGYVHDVSFSVMPSSKHSDSVDVFIRVLDNWSIIPKVAISPSRIVVDLRDKNFLGLGHEAQNGFIWYHTTGNNAYNASYLIPNMRNTYISAGAKYNIDEYKNFTKSIVIDRPFFSPLAKWAGGIYLGQSFQSDSVYFHDSVSVIRKFKFNTQDYWAGKAWQVFKGNTEDERTTNLILSGRFLKIHYLQKPLAIYDSLQSYSDENFYLSGIGISRRKYVQDKFIFNYGITEDVPIGNVYGLTTGYQVKNNIGRMYAGMRFSFGNYNEWGYLSCNFEYGTFFRASHTEQSVFTAGVNYFTGLFEIGKWKLRQFVKPQLTLGTNRFSYETITINNENGIRGFSPSTLTGTKKFTLTLQTQTYSPWNFAGFRFGPYLISSFGMLGNESAGFKKSKIYSQFGFGVLIKNEFLVFDIFQISVAYYPVIPDDGENIFKINQNVTTDFGFRDFTIGKPATIAFQ